MSELEALAVVIARQMVAVVSLERENADLKREIVRLHNEMDPKDAGEGGGRGDGE